MSDKLDLLGKIGFQFGTGLLFHSLANSQESFAEFAKIFGSLTLVKKFLDI